MGLLYECDKLKKKRETLIQSVNKSGRKWPVEKNILGNNYIKYLTKFANSIDFEKLQ